MVVFFLFEVELDSAGINLISQNLKKLLKS